MWSSAHEWLRQMHVEKLTLLLFWLWVCGDLSCGKLKGLSLPLEGDEFILKRHRHKLKARTTVAVKTVRLCCFEDPPVEIQQLIGNLCPDASCINHTPRGGGDAWDNWKGLLAIFQQKQEVKHDGSEMVQPRHRITSAYISFSIIHFNWPSEVLHDCSDLVPDRLAWLWWCNVIGRETR